MMFQIGSSWYTNATYRRNRKMLMDEHREVHNRLHPLYKHEELKYRYLEDEEIRFNSMRSKSIITRKGTPIWRSRRSREFSAINRECGYETVAHIVLLFSDVTVHSETNQVLITHLI